MDAGGSLSSTSIAGTGPSDVRPAWVLTPSDDAAQVAPEEHVDVLGVAADGTGSPARPLGAPVDVIDEYLKEDESQ
jgi:hypothetical protein